MRQIYLPVEVTVQTIVDAVCGSMQHKEILDLVTQIDLMEADVGFTEELIKRLVTSLKADKEDVDLPFIDWEKVK